MTAKAQHARILRMFKSDILMSEENTAQIIDLYETDRMNDEARAAFEALIDFAGELSDKPMTDFELCAECGEVYDRTQLTDKEIAEM